MREVTLLAVRFPDHLSAGGGRGPARVVHRVDDPLVDRIQKGDPTLGWAGDSRLALYLDVPGGMWELWRYERTGNLECVTRFSTDRISAADIVPVAITWLRDHDTQVGFDPFKRVVESNEKVQAVKDAQHRDQVLEAADRVGHALRKDGAA